MEDARRSGARGAVGWFAGAGAAGGSSCGLALIVPRLIEAAAGTHANATLLLGVLAVIGVITAVACAYLATVCVLAALCRSGIAGPRSSRLALGTLRILAPRLARRLASTTATATAAVLLAPPLVAAPAPDRDPVPTPPAATAGSAADSAPTGAAAVPSLAWGARPGALAWTAAASAPAVAADPGVVTVRPGQSLWGIADDLLGPGVDDPVRIHRLVRRIHELNRTVIGPDPDRLDTGQVLVVPSSSDPLTSQEPR